MINHASVLIPWHNLNEFLGDALLGGFLFFVLPMVILAVLFRPPKKPKTDKEDTES